MSAATAAIDTPQRAGELFELDVAAATTIYAGTLVAIDASGNAKPAADAAGLRVIGRAEEDVDNAAKAVIGSLAEDGYFTGGLEEVAALVGVPVEVGVGVGAAEGVAEGDMVGVSVWVGKSKFGAGLRAIKEDEEVAQTMAINAPWLKLKAFALSAFSFQFGDFFQHFCRQFLLQFILVQL